MEKHIDMKQQNKIKNLVERTNDIDAVYKTMLIRWCMIMFQLVS